MPTRRLFTPREIALARAEREAVASGARKHLRLRQLENLSRPEMMRAVREMLRGGGR